MANFTIDVDLSSNNSKTVNLPTGNKFCDRNIVVNSSTNTKKLGTKTFTVSSSADSVSLTKSGNDITITNPNDQSTKYSSFTFDLTNAHSAIKSSYGGATTYIYTVILPIGYANTSPKLNENGSNLVMIGGVFDGGPIDTIIVADWTVVKVNAKTTILELNLLLYPGAIDGYDFRVVVDTPMSI